MSRLSCIKETIMEVLSDYKEHSMEQVWKEVQKKGVDIDIKNSAFRTALYQLRNSGIRIESKEKGLYYLKIEDESIRLKGFTVLEPIERFSKKYIYVHENGKLVLNGKLNGEIISRNIEIRIADNGERIALIANGGRPHRFTKNGYTTNTELLKILARKKIKFPITYEIVEEEANYMWIGVLKRGEKRENSL